MKPAAIAGLALLCGCSSPPGRAPRQAEPPPAGEPRILHFYAYPSTIWKGRSAQICYGLENSSEARIEPRPGSVPPYANRCVEVAPERTTEFVLTAAGGDGRKASQRLTVEVAVGAQPAASPAAPESPAPARISSFTVSPASIAPGGNVTLCYETSEATGVRIEPAVVEFPLPARGCFGHAPKAGTTYRLTASGPGGSDAREVSVAVQ
jgi:hypothetical protein